MKTIRNIFAGSPVMGLSCRVFILIQVIISYQTDFTCAFAQGDTNTATISMEGSHLGVAWGFTYGYEGSKPEVFLPQLHDMGIQLTKLYLFWQQIEPSKGQYDWDTVDTFIHQLNETDEALMAVFSASTWATQVASTTLPPSPAKSLDDYYQFVYQLVKHCEGKIKYWQNDCEPNSPVYWSGTDEEFISQLKVFNRAVKDADPNAIVVAGGYDGLFNPPGMWEFPGQAYGLAFFEKVINEASAYFDLFDLRLYADPYTIPARVQHFQQILSASGNDKPIICTEYNGPGFYEFPVNLSYVNMAAEWQKIVATRDTIAYYNLKNPIVSLYDQMDALAPETQMFMMGCPEELNDKYYRIQCRDIVMRNVLAFSAGVQKTFYWDLYHNTDDKYNLMTLMYGKHKLMDYEDDALAKKFPQADVFKRMSHYLNSIRTIRRIDMPENESLYLFEISQKDKSHVYVVWERREPYSGEDQPPTPYLIPWQSQAATATDIFGTAIPAISSNGNLSIDISTTPIFIEVKE